MNVASVVVVCCSSYVIVVVVVVGSGGGDSDAVSVVAECFLCFFNCVSLFLIFYVLVLSFSIFSTTSEFANKSELIALDQVTSHV